MPNRILKESILDSPTLAKLPEWVQDQFPRLLLLCDDWGCFNADPDVIKGKAYPKRKNVGPGRIRGLIDTLRKSGMLFTWTDGDREWGYWVSWDEHNFCNGGGVDDEGKKLKHRRKTPEPPNVLLNEYLSSLGDKSGRTGTKVLIPNPNPIPNPEKNNPPRSGWNRTFERVRDSWNQNRGPLPECRSLGAQRVAKIRTRRENNPDFDANFTEAAMIASTTPFLCGENDRGWMVTIDWLLENDLNYLKVLEGNYGESRNGNRPRAGPHTHTCYCRRPAHEWDCGAEACNGLELLDCPEKRRAMQEARP